MINRTWITLTAALFFLSWSGECQDQKKSLPNIVLLYADDMGYGDLNVQNPESKIPTPNLDRLAREGIRFADAHSSSGICTPSRYALLTGRYHWRKFHGIVRAFGGSVFSRERLTLPEMLKEAGYRTACIGKWHLGWDWNALKKLGARATRKGYAPGDFDWSKSIPDGPLAHGFDFYFGDDVPNFPPYTWIENDRILIAPTRPYAPDPVPAEGSHEGRPGPMAEGWRLDEVMPRLTSRAVEWIAKHKASDRPFFLYFPWTSPHAPIVPAKEFIGKTKAGGYGDFMFQSDRTAGRVLKALDDNGFRKNTIIIFTSDNGPEHYAYNRIRTFQHRSMGPLRGLKRDIWEGGHRVPLVIRWPGRIEAGRTSRALVSQIDLMATLAGIVKYDLPDDAAEDSHDLLPLLDGTSGKKDIRTVHIHNTRANHFAVRKGKWVLIDAKSGHHTRVPKWFDRANGYEKDDHNAALYNLDEDLAERRNLIDEHPEKAAELRTLLRKIRSRGFSAPRLVGSRPRRG